MRSNAPETAAFGSVSRSRIWRAVSEHSDLIGDLCRPHVRALVDTFRESASAAVLREGRIEYVGEGCGAPIVADRVLIRPRAPAALLGGRQGPAREPAGPGTRGSPGRARSRRTHAAYDHRAGVSCAGSSPGSTRQGFGVDDQETEEGLRCIAVPIRGDDRAVVAALSISGPVSRMTDARMADYSAELKRRAAQVSGALYTESKVLPDRAKPRADYPHVKVVGDFVFVSGISARRPDETFVGARVTRSGEVELDIREQSVRPSRTSAKSSARSEARSRMSSKSTRFSSRWTTTKDSTKSMRDIFDASGPARTTVAVRALPHPHQILMVKAVARVTHRRS